MSRNRIFSSDRGISLNHLKFVDIWIDGGRVIYPHLFWQLQGTSEEPLTFVVRYD